MAGNGHGHRGAIPLAPVPHGNQPVRCARDSECPNDQNDNRPTNAHTHLLPGARLHPLGLAETRGGYCAGAS